jgi:hypothetical protein
MAMIVRSIEDKSGMHCVDIIEDESTGTFTFKVFRKDPEDYGRWSLTADYSKTAYGTHQAALDVARLVVPWLA